MYGGESDLPFRQGDFVRNDYVAYLNGLCRASIPLGNSGQANA